MRISQLHVINYRSILDETLECDNLTILVGRNGAGKSAFLQALRLFMDTATSPSTEDFYNHDLRNMIQVEVTFSDLNAEEQAEFQSYLDGGLLVVQRKFPGGDYYGRANGCEELEPIRERLRQKAKVSEVALELRKIVESGKYPGLSAVNRGIEEELDRWERENPTSCRAFFRAGLFQGPTNIAGGKMRNRTHFVYVPPVREAENDASGGGRQSPLATLVSPLVNIITEKNPAVKTARESLETDYGTYKAAVEGAPEKNTLESNLTTLLQRYDRDTAAEIQLSLEDKLALPSVKPRVWLVEDGFQGDVARKGHGLQRLFIFTILELYEKLRGGTTDSATQGNMVLAIEEPELYQHPARSRALARVLSDLCNPKEGNSFQFQVFFTTHSPYFVSIDNFESIRRIEKVTVSTGPMETKVRRTTLKAVGNSVLVALGRSDDATKTSSWARLKSIMGIRGSEGFFADGVILVEGAEDEAIVSAFAEHKKVSLDAAGICIIPAEGKTKLPPLLALYQCLGIDVYLIFDADGDQLDDKKAQTDYNKALLTMINESAEARPSTNLFQNGTVWTTNFLDEVRRAFGEEKWEVAFTESCEEFALSSDQAKKKYAVLWRTVELLLGQGILCKPLELLWENITKRFGLKSGVSVVSVASSSKP